MVRTIADTRPLQSGAHASVDLAGLFGGNIRGWPNRPTVWASASFVVGGFTFGIHGPGVSHQIGSKRQAAGAPASPPVLPITVSRRVRVPSTGS